MNDITIPPSTIPSDVRLFLAAVRRELGDLDAEEVAEMTDGLEADLTDLVAERGAGALGDPKAYAQELRTAAGVVGVAGPRSRRPVGESVAAYLDACHDWFDRQVDRIPGDSQPVIAWLQPAWWIARAWVAVTLLDLFFASGRLIGMGVGRSLWGFGWIVLVIAVAVSIMIGAGRIWPGGTRGLFARLVLLGLNGFAVVMTPLALASTSDYGPEWSEAWNDGYMAASSEAEAQPSGSGRQLTLHGRNVTNIYPYDAEGRPLAGVQLFDQKGRPLDVAADPYCPVGADWELQVSEEWDGEKEVCFDSATSSNVPGTVLYGWTNGQAQLKNVFPLASRPQELMVPSGTAFQESAPPTLGTWPFANASKVSLPGILAGLVEPTGATGATGDAVAPSATPTASPAP